MRKLTEKLAKWESAIKNYATGKNLKQFLKPTLLLTGIYLLGYISLIRANALYMDDMGRTIQGYRGWDNWGRYVNNFLAVFIHADTNLTDISPLPQLIAIFILAISSVLLVYILCDKKMTVINLAASIPLGLSPYILQCLSYKYDAPYMALSVLVSIIPFLFLQSKVKFAVSSILCVLVMCMTYQASSGIYVMLVVIISFLNWNKNQEQIKNIFLFAVIAALCFCGALLIFRFFIMTVHNEVNGYASTAMFPVARIFSGMIQNMETYVKYINSDFFKLWKIGIMIIGTLFVFDCTVRSKRNKIAAIILAVAVICVLFFLSFGAYIVLEKPMYEPRALYGFGGFLAIICICAVSHRNKAAAVSVFALSWCFFVFSFSYGNALADQKRWMDFRAEILLQDLSTLGPDLNKYDMAIQLEGWIGFAPSINNVAKHYPIITRLVPVQLGLGTYIWGNTYLLEYFNWGTINMIAGFIQQQFDDTDLQVVLDSYYHTIKTDGQRIVVVFKH
jgi:hypothetical protein